MTTTPSTMTTTTAKPATTTKATPATTTPTLFFARMGITYESWLKMKAIHLKQKTHGKTFGSTFFQRFGVSRDSWRKFTSIKKEMYTYAKKVKSGEIQVAKPRRGPKQPRMLDLSFL